MPTYKHFFKIKEQCYGCRQIPEISHFKSLKPLKRIVVYMPQLILQLNIFHCEPAEDTKPFVFLVVLKSHT
jgi:hypothetical protein